jgi:predicted ATPase
MKLDQIKIKGFKSIKEADIELGDLNVLIGANGAGKTNFISLFKLLNKMIDKNFQSDIAESGGAENFMHYGHKTTAEIDVYLKFGINAYNVIWKPSADNRLVFSNEICIIEKNPKYKEKTVEIGKGYGETNLDKAAKEKEFSIEKYVYQNLKSWKYYHFHDTSETAKVKKMSQINDNMYLRTDASNLAAFLYLMQEKHHENYEAIRDAVKLVAPFFDNFILRINPFNEEMIRLEWREKGSDFPFLANQFSDGTLRFICLATVLLQPKLPSTIIIDEPELGLHPYAIKVLASLMKSASKKTQIIVSTQSVPLVNEFEPENLIVVDKIENASVFKKVTSKELSSWLEEYTLGELWEKNVLGGRPQ